MNYDDKTSERKAKNNSLWDDPAKQLIFWRIIAAVVTCVIYIAAIFIFSE